MSEYADRVKKIIASTLNRQESTIKDEAKIIEDLGADSLDVIELTMNLEEEFGIKIEDEESELITTVGEAIAVVEKRLGGSASEAKIDEASAEAKADDSKKEN
ncbi:MAG: acyl carrier protein [Victivallales bacterium]|nr:acyl carrier protein [Victivallales bacterium]